jgi:glycosyltransferase involved in cell wall biosynthesis
MNVLVVTSAYPKFDGDSTAPFMASIVEHIACKGHSMHVVLPEHRDWKRADVEKGISFHPYRYSPVESWTPWGFGDSLEAGISLRRRLYALAPAVLVSARRACRRVVARENVDVIHAHWVVPNGTIALGASKRRRIPLVITLHGSDISLSERSRWMSSIARHTLAGATIVTAPSEDLLSRARALGASGDLELIPWGADPGKFQPDVEAAKLVRTRYGLAADDVLVVGVGRLVHWKGFRYLIDAVGGARSRVPSIRLVLVGNGDVRDELEARVRQLDLSQRISFAGMLPREGVAAHLAAADIVAVPSIHYGGFVDGQPTVALEAMAAGRPLIVTRVGGLPQLVEEGQNGLIVEEQDADALADAIVELATDSGLRRRMGERSRRRIVESFTWEQVATRLVATYERAVQQAR